MKRSPKQSSMKRKLTLRNARAKSTRRSIRRLLRTIKTNTESFSRFQVDVPVLRWFEPIVQLNQLEQFERRISYAQISPQVFRSLLEYRLPRIRIRNTMRFVNESKQPDFPYYKRHMFSGRFQLCVNGPVLNAESPVSVAT
jgi:hypothetical protein